MPHIQLPVQFHQSHSQLQIDPVTTAFMLVDCNGANSFVVQEHISPALAAARRSGMKVFYFHENGHGIGGPLDITREVHGARYGKELPSELTSEPQWRNECPQYDPTIAPLADEPDFSKASKDGFETTRADYFLRRAALRRLSPSGLH